MSGRPRPGGSLLFSLFRMAGQEGDVEAEQLEGSS